MIWRFNELSYRCGKVEKVGINNIANKEATSNSEQSYSWTHADISYLRNLKEH